MSQSPPNDGAVMDGSQYASRDLVEFEESRTALVSNPSWRRTDKGLEFIYEQGLLRLEVVNEDIIRVLCTPLNQWPAKQSCMVLEQTSRSATKWEIRERENTVSLETNTIEARVSKFSTRVSFFDKNGFELLAESPNGRIFIPSTVLGEETYQIEQRFDAPSVRTIHGLGSHQNRVANYKGKDVLLSQQNVVAATSFFVTDQRWGLLWDNDSITRFGDPRPMTDLSALVLRGRDGQTGGLSATYYKDADFQEALAMRLESEQAYEFIPDIPGDAPKDFSFQTGSIRWEGTIEAKQSGTHRFQLYGSSYTKIWVDGKLLVDRWRQNWMPWTNEFELDLETGAPLVIRIDWICDDGYHAFKCLPPAPDSLAEQIILNSEVGELIDYYFVHGQTPNEVVSNYRILTGRAPLMPRWAYGFWQCRERYQTQQELLDTARRFRELGLPLDNIVQDWFYWPEDSWGDHEFDPERYPDPQAMVDTIHQDLNAHLMISVWPKFYTSTENYKSMNANGWIYPRNVELGEKDWVGPGYVSSFYDAFNPEAGKAFWQGISEKLFSLGVDAWWIDATEADIHSNTSVLERKLRMNPTSKGSGARVFNAYSIHASQSVYEGQRSEKPDQRVFILTRSCHSGQQRYSATTWSGDVAASWQDLANQITAGFNFCASGIPYWTSDIGGFAVEPRFERPSSDADREEWRELQLRWFQFGAFCPIFRSHGQFPPREPFNIAPPGHPVYQSMLRYTKFRYRLLPYIYSLAGAVTHRGSSIMKPLAFDFPEDERAAHVQDQFLFGDCLMVAPVVEHQARQRSVYLPHGSDWFHLQSNRRFSGGRSVTVEAPLEDLALFARAGSFLFLGPEQQFTGQHANETVEVRIYPGADATFLLYEDDGLSYQYENFKYTCIEFRWSDRDRELSIGERQGAFEGMLEKRFFKIVDGSRIEGDAFEHASLSETRISYNGKACSVSLPRD
ncbi:TIM-barrel domain-containing protein [Pelagicoccus sp. SDUM812003]|uniref:TIM-barrel domain-containing protein n=1 Tax=Pelagicoccus sp. SDUM812003 TaxID=3041267 RepID=UPI00280E93AE|nr:TIM-barrel domain-containing protein [Pelagicoccus sp. SDUM812003]MDQ8201925.1 glycoside hydrolase family 31 protein [Pelagicoccus sp. SDUM812003]